VDQAENGEQAIATDEFSDPHEFLNALAYLPLAEARWIFRGQSDADWPLAPLIERIQLTNGYDIREAERGMLLAFKRRAHQYLQHPPEDKDTLEWLALMQHYGAPTRLLDWTRSPHVATFFALAEADPEKGSAGWAVDAQSLKLRAIDILRANDIPPVDASAHFGSPEIFN
jgi:hypothetical protein